MPDVTPLKANGSHGVPQKVQSGDTVQPAASTSGAAALNIPSGAAVTSPNDGDEWYDGTHLYFRHGATSTDLLAGGGGSGPNQNFAAVDIVTYTLYSGV